MNKKGATALILGTFVFIFFIIVGFLIKDFIQKQNTEIQQLKETSNKLKLSNNEIQKKISKEEACRQADNLLTQIKSSCGSMPFPGVDECIKKRLDASNWINWQPKPSDPIVAAKEEQNNLDRAHKMQELKVQYVLYRDQCGE